jgi:hypothetical protein
MGFEPRAGSEEKSRSLTFVRDDRLGGVGQFAARLKVVPSRSANASGAGLCFGLARVIGVGGDVDVAGGLELAGFLVEVYGVSVHDHGASVAGEDAFAVWSAGDHSDFDISAQMKNPLTVVGDIAVCV